MRIGILRGTLASVALLASALAQTPSESGDSDAGLYVTPKLNGDVEISVSDFAMPDKQFAAIMRESLGCDWRFTGGMVGVCRKLLPSGITSLDGRLALAPLVAALRKAGATWLEVTLYAQGQPGPGWKKETYKGKAPLLHYERAYYTFVSEKDGELPSPFQIRMGEAWHPVRLAAPFGLVLFGPALLAFYLRRRGQRTGNRGGPVIWLNWILLAAWLYWMSAVSLTDVAGFSLWLHASNAALSLAIGVAVFALPPLAAAASCVMILMVETDEESRLARGRMLKRLLTQQAALIVPLGVFYVGAELFEYDHTVGMTSLPLAFVLFRVLNWTAGRLGASTVWSITGGELYDRVLALASAAGAKVKGVCLLSSRLAQEVNAYATSSGQVMVTRGLVERLTKRELDAVVAHEVGHLRGGHVGVNVLMFWAYFLIAPWAHSALGKLGVPAWVLQFPIVTVAYVLVAAQISQRHEFSADARSVQLTGDPEAMIASLARLTRITRSPVSWGGFQGSILSHPSMKTRVLAIADRFSLPHERALAILDNPDIVAGEAPEHYALPAGLQNAEPIYSSSARASHIFWASWGTRVALVLMLAAMAVTAPTVTGQFRAVALFFACVPLAAWLYLRLANWWDRQFKASMRRKIALRMQPEEGAIFVGLRPGARVYPVAGFYDWDLGFVTLSADWLSYRGEQAQFSVARSAVCGIEVAHGPIAWDRTFAVVVRHTGGAFVLRRSDAGISLRQARKLAAKLTAWWQGTAPADTVQEAPYPPPSLPEFAPAFPARIKLAIGFAWKAGGLFVGTLIILATTVPMNGSTMMFSLVPFAAPLAFLVAVAPLLFRRRPV